MITKNTKSSINIDKTPPRTSGLQYLIIIIVSLIVGFAISFYANYNPPVIEVNSITMVNNVVKSSTAQLKLDITWNRACTTRVDVFVMEKNGDVLWRNPEQPLMAYGWERGRKTWVRTINIPDTLKNGEYQYRIRFQAKCDEKEHIVAVPDIPFIIDR